MAEELRPRPKLQKAQVGEEFRKAGERLGDVDTFTGRLPEPPDSDRDIIIGKTE